MADPSYLMTTTELQDDGLCWHPLVYTGDFEHPTQGRFRVTPDDLGAMVDAFQHGVPGRAGVPICEQNHHRVDGAFGYVQQVDIRDGALWGGIKWSDRGKAAVESGEWPYLSAVFNLNYVDNPMFRDFPTVVKRVSLTDEPFFHAQPVLDGSGYQISASMYADLVSGGAEADTGGTDMAGTAPETITEAQARAILQGICGEITDERWAEMTAETGETTDWAEFLVGHARPEAPEDADDAAGGDEQEQDAGESSPEQAPAITLEDLARSVNEITARLDGLSDSTQQVQQVQQVAASLRDLSTEIRDRDRQIAEREFRGQVRATMFGDAGDPHAIAPTAEDLLVAARMNPCADTVNALVDHILNHGGLQTYPRGEIAAAMYAGTSDRDQCRTYLQGRKYDGGTIDKIMALMTDSKSVIDAETEFLRAQIP